MPIGMDDVESVADRLSSIFSRIAVLEAADEGNIQLRDSKDATAGKFAVIENRLARLEEALGVASCKPRNKGPTSAPCNSLGEPLANAETTRAAIVTQQRLAMELTDRGVHHAFVRVPADYYDHDLEYRRQCLGAHSVNSLCKTIVMENTKAPKHFGISSDPMISKYTCVITQYAVRLHADKVKRFIHKLNGTLGIKHFNMRLAPPEVSDELTGYSHNAVTPVGMKTKLPILLSHHIPALEPDWFWLGAGETNLKVGFSARKFVEAYSPIIMDCTYDD